MQANTSFCALPEPYYNMGCTKNQLMAVSERCLELKFLGLSSLIPKLEECNSFFHSGPNASTTNNQNLLQKNSNAEICVSQ